MLYSKHCLIAEDDLFKYLTNLITYTLTYLVMCPMFVRSRRLAALTEVLAMVPRRLRPPHYNCLTGTAVTGAVGRG